MIDELFRTPRHAWTLAPNPTHKPGSEPMPACHDNSRFVTILCNCGTAHHIHETQLPRPSQDGLIVAICKPANGGCGEILEIPLDWLHAAMDEAWS